MDGMEKSCVYLIQYLFSFLISNIFNIYYYKLINYSYKFYNADYLY